MIKIIPLTQEQLTNAISLLEKIFSYKPDQKLFKYSLTDSQTKKAYGQIYWIAVDGANRVIGIIGLYDDRKDKTVSWLGWFGVHPNYRQHGTGSLLLQYAIDQAVQKGSTRLRLYTSSDSNEIAAHHMYKKFGFQQTSIDREADKIFFMKNLEEDSMSEYEIKIDWSGPHSLTEVIETMNDGGSEANGWVGKDYGLYQIYGRHILYERNALLYVGIAIKQTFSQRFSQHKSWLIDDQEGNDIKIHLGRVDDPLRYSKEDQWKAWEEDVEIAEKILIYKYSPNYNSKELSIEPDLGGHVNIRLTHTGEVNRLKPFDQAPKDFREW